MSLYLSGRLEIEYTAVHHRACFNVHGALMHKMSSDERKCSVMKGCFCND